MVISWSAARSRVSSRGGWPRWIDGRTAIKRMLSKTSSGYRASPFVHRISIQMFVDGAQSALSGCMFSATPTMDFSWPGIPSRSTRSTVAT